MTTGTPRKAEEVTSFSPGVAQILSFSSIGVLGDCHSHDSQLGIARLWGNEICVGKHFFFLCFSCEFHRDNHMIQYKNKIFLCTITFSFFKLFLILMIFFKKNQTDKGGEHIGKYRTEIFSLNEGS